LAVAFLMVTLLVVNFDEIIDTVGTGGILAALIVLVGGFVAGFLVGGARRNSGRCSGWAPPSGTCPLPSLWPPRTYAATRR
jgi:hypothetical protein